MTGAPLPIGYDAVIKVEEVKKFSRDGNTYIQIEKNLNYFENVRNEGGDFKKGNVVLKKNEKITEAHLMAMASLGITSVEVYARPKVVLISTGNELVEPGSIITPGKIRNSTGVYLTAVLRKLGCDVEYCGIIADETKYFFEKIKEILKNPPDIIISTGAVSMGKYDFITSAIKDLGADIYFHKVAIRPGKPLLFAKFPNEKTMFFGLPGNPVSSSVGIRFFIVPFLRESFGIKSEKPIRAKLINHFKKPEGLRCFFKSKLSLSKQENPEVEILEGQASFIVQSLTKANAWVVLEESGSAVSMGDWLDVYPLLLMTDDWTEALDDTSQAFNAKGCC
jgi:molybdopterin molybdotransferase